MINFFHLEFPIHMLKYDHDKLYYSEDVIPLIHLQTLHFSHFVSYSLEIIIAHETYFGAEKCHQYVLT